VPHFHLHVLPRWDGDGLPVAWPMKSPSREQLEEYAARIRAKVT
jgi:histidine triad (HIT) family protein